MSDSINVASHVASIRGGIGATLGLIGSQLPYPYVHVMYWIMQIMQIMLTVQTGCGAGGEYKLLKEWLEENIGGTWNLVNSRSK